MNSIKETSYKVISASAVTLDSIATPAIRHSHNLMIEGSKQIETSVNKFIETLEKNSNDSLG